MPRRAARRRAVISHGHNLTDTLPSVLRRKYYEFELKGRSRSNKALFNDRPCSKTDHKYPALNDATTSFLLVKAQNSMNKECIRKSCTS